MSSKKQVNIRLPDHALRQLEDLRQRLGATQVQVIMLALDRLEQQMNKGAGSS